MSATGFTVETGEDWALLSLSSPSGLVKLGEKALTGLADEVEHLLVIPSLRCLALRGLGQSFAVGADLREIARLTPSSGRAFSALGNRLYRMLEKAPVLSLAAIDGYCLGGGLDLALACDFRLASERSSFSHPGPQLGIITGWGGTQRLPRLVGQKKALAWLLTARRYGAEEALRWGLVQEVCPVEDFEGRVRERAGFFAAFGRDEIGRMKDELRR